VWFKCELRSQIDGCAVKFLGNPNSLSVSCFDCFRFDARFACWATNDITQLIKLNEVVALAAQFV
jgi:hypothetical protein